MKTETRSINSTAWFVDPETIGTPEFQNRADTFFKPDSAPWQRLGARGQSGGASLLTEEPTAPRPERPARGKGHPVIFVPTDFTEETLDAVKLGVTLARQSGGHLVLFHSVHLNLTPYGPANPQCLAASLRQEAAEKAEPIMNCAQAAGVRVTSVVEEGAPAPAILKNAARWNADMLVLTTQRRGWLSRLFRGRTVERVVLAAKCPVMVLRRDGKKKLTGA